MGQLTTSLPKPQFFSDHVTRAERSRLCATAVMASLIDNGAVDELEWKSAHGSLKTLMRNGTLNLLDLVIQGLWYLSRQLVFIQNGWLGHHIL